MRQTRKHAKEWTRKEENTVGKWRYQLQEASPRHIRKQPANDERVIKGRGSNTPERDVSPPDDHNKPEERGTGNK
ncbi:hypothetical protein VTN49DRAFT_7982 [Thermomyces lanuginosus]|uniref:uncharacterized protein n=1 Tax=Thermomyces lanuginosus TaxID=5541 RepID=UPI003742152A